MGSESDEDAAEILVMLKERNLSAGEIAEKFSLTKATVSHHLSVLRQAGLVDTEKRAQTVIYSLNLTVFQSFLLAVNGLFADKDFKGSRKAETTGSPSGALRSGARIRDFIARNGFGVPHSFGDNKRGFASLRSFGDNQHGFAAVCRFKGDGRGPAPLRPFAVRL